MANNPTPVANHFTMKGREGLRSLLDYSIRHALGILGKRNDAAEAANLAVNQMSDRDWAALLNYVTTSVVEQIAQEERQLPQPSGSVEAPSDVNLTDEAMTALSNLINISAYSRDMVISHALVFLDKAMQHRAGGEDDDDDLDPAQRDRDLRHAAA